MTTSKWHPSDEYEAESTPEEPAAKVLDTVDRIRAFEDEHLGKDALRINDEVEKGHGSKFSELGDDLKAEYANLQTLILAENALAGAKQALIAAEQAHATAKYLVDKEK